MFDNAVFVKKLVIVLIFQKISLKPKGGSVQLRDLKKKP